MIYVVGLSVFRKFLATRQSARLGSDGANPITTSYLYSDWGQLEDVDYTNDLAATADLGYSYDRIGRLVSVTQGGSNHATYTYDPGDLMMQTERHARNTNPSRLLTRKRDTYLRATGYTLGSVADPDSINEVTYTYGLEGRAQELSCPEGGVTPAPHTFTYNYEAASRHLISSVTGPAHLVTNTWESNRNVLLEKDNQHNGTTISSFTYSVNSIGQREDLTTAGTAFASADLGVTNWNYNTRGELISAAPPYSTGDRTYEYDAIGNRLKSAESDTLPSSENYQANSLNQYVTTAGS